jgi:hypothetical protein
MQFFLIAVNRFERLRLPPRYQPAKMLTARVIFSPLLPSCCAASVYLVADSRSLRKGLGTCPALPTAVAEKAAFQRTVEIG